MNYKIDLHIHTVLSPCACLEMSPKNIIQEAKNKKIDIIGITDHNSTKNTLTTEKIGKKNGVYVLKGVEVNTKEEIHCLAFFEKTEEINEFQKYLETNLLFIQNNSSKFGYQLVVDENENILEEIQPLLTSSLIESIDAVVKKVNELNGIFIPAHVNKKRNSIFSQIGFIPNDLMCKTVEISKFYGGEFDDNIINMKTICNSDAHILDEIGSNNQLLEIEELNFKSIKKALGQ